MEYFLSNDSNATDMQLISLIMYEKQKVAEEPLTNGGQTCKPSGINRRDGET